ncbi:hypothetical protein D3C84_1091970 [compost metagenome]
MGSGAETIETRGRAHKPTDSGVTVGNDARSCSPPEIPYNLFKQALAGNVERPPRKQKNIPDH